MNSFESLHWTEKMEIVNLSAMLLTIPIDSGVSLFFSVFWVIGVVLKNTILKRWSFFGWHQDKNYQYGSKYFLIPMVCYWAMYLISMLWTENQVSGWTEVSRLGWFVLLPVTCACTDFRQISVKGIRMMLWIFVLTLSILFVGALGNVVIQLCITPGQSFLWYMILHDFYHIHHSYMALYILTGLAFLYSELVRDAHMETRQLMRILVCACCLLLFLLCINSRAGLLCLLFMLVLCWAHMCFVRKKYRFALVSLAFVLLLVVVAHYTLPQHFRRLSVTMEQVAKGDKSDERFVIMENSWSVVKDNMLLGVGAGDRMDELVPYYGSLEEVYCPHNQYLDTWMATGVAGLSVLLIMLFWPFIKAWKKRLIFPFLFLLMLMLSLLFESMLERQMGVSFTGVMYVFMAIIFSMGSNNNKINFEYE